jgi:hypothetical protein
VESDGCVCIEGDPGPLSEASAEHRIGWLLDAFQQKFLRPWLRGELDGDFAIEPLDYWRIHVEQHAQRDDVIRAVWVAEGPSDARLAGATLFTPPGIIVVHSDNRVVERIRNSLGSAVKQEYRIIVADIPFFQEWTPSNWPRTMEEIRLLLKGRLSERDSARFLEPRYRRGRMSHRVVLLRNPSIGFAYLLPGGPAIQVGEKKNARAKLPPRNPRPLNVSRIDASWIVGRDQHPEVQGRQRARILVLGAGALGSVVVDQLARAGVGQIDLVDPEILVAANLGRHLLGAESIGSSKARAVAGRVEKAHPYTTVRPAMGSAEDWLRERRLSGVDVVLDLTGEPAVRWHVEKARRETPCALLIGWMEPYVAAAHACLLPTGFRWMQDGGDPMGRLEAVSWPRDVIRKVPGCSSSFQSYTAAAAAHAVALVAEQALALIDGKIQDARIVSWVRGQRYLDAHRDDLALRDWASPAADYDGMLLERPYRT